MAVVVLTGIAIVVVPPILAPCCRSREVGNRVRCAANLKMIGDAALLYAHSHQGQFPDSIEALLQAQSVEIPYFSALICPTTDDEAREDADRHIGIQKLHSRGQPSQYALSAERPWLHISYVYAGRGKSLQTPPETILLYETISNHNEDGMNILFADGHVEWYMKKDVVKMIAEIQSGHNPPRPEMLK